MQGTRPGTVAFGRLALRTTTRSSPRPSWPTARSRGRGLLPDARPVRRQGGVRDARLRCRRVRRVHRALPRQQAFRKLPLHRIVALREGQSPVGPKVRQAYVTSRDRRRRRRPRRADARRRAGGRPLEAEHAAELADRRSRSTRHQPGDRQLRGLGERIERAPAPDRPVRALPRAVVRALPPGRRATCCTASRFGQPAHPPLVLFPLGCWILGAAARLCGGGSEARARVGHDWIARAWRPHCPHAAGRPGRLVGSCTSISSGSACARRSRAGGRGRLLFRVGAARASAGTAERDSAGRGRPGHRRGLAATSGGYLAHRLGPGQATRNRSAPGRDRLAGPVPLADCPRDGRSAGSSAPQPAGGAGRASPCACSRTSAPTSASAAPGRVVIDGGRACVVCPWHGSTFGLTDGSVRRGPATARQPAFETRISDSAWSRSGRCRPAGRQGDAAAAAALQNGSRVTSPFPSGPVSGSGGSSAAAGHAFAGRAGEEAANALERLAELAWHDPHLVGAALRELREHLRYL